MKASYHKMNTLKACITDKNMYLHMPGQEPKVASIDANQQMVDIMLKQPVITKEEFEQSIPHSTAFEAFYKSWYLMELQPKPEMV